MRKKYVLKLSGGQGAELQEVIRKAKPAAWGRQRAQALLKGDQGPSGPGWTDARTAQAYGCTTRRLEPWRKRAVERAPCRCGHARRR